MPEPAHPPRRIHPLRTTIAYYMTNLVLGLTVASLGPTLEGLAEQVGTDLGGTGLMLPMRALGYMAFGLLAGGVYQRVRGHTVMGGGLLIVAGLFYAISLANSLWLLLVLGVLAGAFKNLIDVGENSLLVRMHGDRSGPYMNGLHFFFGFGAFVAPIIVAQVLLATDAVAWAYRIFALLMLVPALWVGLLPTPGGTDARAPTGEDVPMQNPTFWLLVILIFLYVGAEISYAGWVFTYARQRDLASEAQAAYLTSLFWGALTAGRLLSVPLAMHYDPRLTLGLNLGGALVSVGLLLVLPYGWALWGLTLTVGLSMAAVFPTVMVLAARYLSASARVIGLIMIGGGLGAMVFPGVIGQLIEPVGPAAVMGVIALCLVGAVSVYGLLVARLRRA